MTPVRQTFQEELLNYDKVVAFFTSKDPEEVVGTALDAHSCPLAQYLLAQDFEEVTVASRGVLVSRNENGRMRTYTWTSPLWVRNAVKLIDRGPLTFHQATAGQCVEVLQLVRRFVGVDENE